MSTHESSIVGKKGEVDYDSLEAKLQQKNNSNTKPAEFLQVKLKKSEPKKPLEIDVSSVPENSNSSETKTNYHLGRTDPNFSIERASSNSNNHLSKSAGGKVAVYDFRSAVPKKVDSPVKSSQENLTKLSSSSLSNPKAQSNANLNMQSVSKNYISTSRTNLKSETELFDFRLAVLKKVESSSKESNDQSVPVKNSTIETAVPFAVQLKKVPQKPADYQVDVGPLADRKRTTKKNHEAVTIKDSNQQSTPYNIPLKKVGTKPPDFQDPKIGVLTYSIVKEKSIVSKGVNSKGSPDPPEPENPYSMQLKKVAQKPVDYVAEEERKSDFVTRREKDLREASRITAEKKISDLKLKKSDRPIRPIKVGNTSHVVIEKGSFVPPALKEKDLESPFKPKSSFLLRIKGKRRVYATAVKFDYHSLNHDDTFVLVCPEGLYCWVGKRCGAVKKAKGKDILLRLWERDYRQCVPKNIVDGTDSKLESEFLAILNGNPISEDINGENDQDWEFEFESKIKLYRFDESKDKEVVATGKIPVKHLDQEAAFVLDTEDVSYVWGGPLSLADHRNAATAFAYSTGKPVSLQKPTAEELLFRDKFSDWSEGMDITPKQVKNIGAHDRTWGNYHRATHVGVYKTIDLHRMYLGAPEIASGVPKPKPIQIQPGTLILEGLQILEDAKESYPVTEFGIFYSGETYIIKASFLDQEKLTTLLFYWIGSESKSGYSALKVLELDPQREIPQQRLIQGNESATFLDIFGGVILVRNGTKNGENNATKLFQVVETLDHRIRIHEQANSHFIHNGSTFLISDNHEFDIWTPKSTPEDTVARVEDFLARHHLLVRSRVRHGSEPPSFLRKLEIEKVSIFMNNYFETHQAPIKRRLFRISFITLGNATADEVDETLSQSCLISHGIFILDAFFELYVWIGHQIVESKDPMYQMINLALTTAVDYAEIVNHEEGGRLDTRKILLTFQGQESNEFKSHFPTWKIYAFDLADGSKFGLLQNSMLVERALKEMESKKWPLKEIRKFVENGVPLGVDPKRIEDYLQDLEFQQLFGMSKAEYEKLPAWKQLEKKKQLNLISS